MPVPFSFLRPHHSSTAGKRAQIKMTPAMVVSAGIGAMVLTSLGYLMI